MGKADQHQEPESPVKLKRIPRKFVSHRLRHPRQQYNVGEGTCGCERVTGHIRTAITNFPWGSCGDIILGMRQETSLRGSIFGKVALKRNG